MFYPEYEFFTEEEFEPVTDAEIRQKILYPWIKDVLSLYCGRAKTEEEELLIIEAEDCIERITEKYIVKNSISQRLWQLVALAAISLVWATYAFDEECLLPYPKRVETWLDLMEMPVSNPCYSIYSDLFKQYQRNLLKDEDYNICRTFRVP